MKTRDRATCNYYVYIFKQEEGWGEWVKLETHTSHSAISLIKGGNVFIKLAVSAQFIWIPVNNPWLPTSKCMWKSWGFRATYWASKVTLAMPWKWEIRKTWQSERARTDQKSPEAGLPSFTSSQAVSAYSVLTQQGPQWMKRTPHT